MSDAGALDLAGVAEALGLHYVTVKKNWRRWVEPGAPGYVAFPAPVLCPEPGKRGALRWRAAAIEAWRQGRERAFGAASIKPPTHRHDRAGHLAASRAVHSQRAALAAMMERV